MRANAVQKFAHAYIGRIAIKTLGAYIKLQHPQSYKTYWPLLVALRAIRKRIGVVPAGDRRALPDISFPESHPGRLDAAESTELAGVKRKRV